MSFEPRATYATLPRTQRGVPIVLGGDPKGKNFLYCNGTSVIIRDIANPAVSDIYTEHSQPTTVAKYSPSGFYISSGDASGKIRIWDTVNKEHVLKNEFHVLGGAVKDISWTSDNKWMVAVGEGRDRFGAIFNAEMGSSVGEIMGQSKSLNSCDFSPVRPFKVVTASEDNTLAFFEDRPLKFKFTISDHQRFVNAVRYSPDGSVFASGGADGKSFIYDGKTGEKKGEMGSPAHKGGIYAICFSPDSSKLLTVSGDKTAKIWDAQTCSMVTEFTMGNSVEDMQLGCLWQGDFLLTVSLSGYINSLDVNNPARPLRVLKGHNKPITSMVLNEDRSSIFTAGSDGGVCRWNAMSGEQDMFAGKGHSNQVQDMALVQDTLVSCGIDDTLMYSSVSSNQFGNKIGMPSQPRSVAAAEGGLAIVACINEVVVTRNQQIVYTHKVDYEPMSVAIHPGMTEVAVGGAKDQKTHILTLSGDTLTEGRTLDHGGAVTDLKYSPDGAHLVACDAYRKVILYRLPDYEALTANFWSNHTAKVNSVDWTPDGLHLGSGSLDTNIICWYPEERSKFINIKGAHPMSQVTRVAWLDNNTIASVGQDSNLKLWTVKF